MSRLDEQSDARVDELIFPCDCHDSHYLRFTWDREEPRWSFMWIESHERPRGWQRIAVAWRSLRGKEFMHDVIILSAEVAQTIHDQIEVWLDKPNTLAWACPMCSAPANITNGQTSHCTHCGNDFTYTAATP